MVRDGSPEDVRIIDTETQFAIEWKGEYRIEGEAFIYTDRRSGCTVTILGCPVRRIEEGIPFCLPTDP